MARCKVPCVDLAVTSGFTNRQKWNYVKNLYHRAYTIDASGNRLDSRATNDPARIEDEDNYNLLYDVDYLEWQTRQTNGHTEPFERFLEWKFSKGTSMYGNLPQWKKDQHVGYCWMPCPYSTESSDARSETMLGSVEPKNDHGIYYMKGANKGTIWGYECTYDGCPYYLANGKRYFYA